ncbi:MAG: hypothetical protein EOP46_08365, partial [Sphingobacteriaceae bacterium]
SSSGNSSASSSSSSPSKPFSSKPSSSSSKSSKNLSSSNINSSSFSCSGVLLSKRMAQLSGMSYDLSKPRIQSINTRRNSSTFSRISCT